MAAGLGGYIVIGIGEVQVESGRELNIQGFAAEQQRQFDISNIRQLVEQYADVRIDLKAALVAGEVHSKRRFGLVCVMPASEFPIVVARDGAYREGRKERFAFKDGDILVRRNASTVRARQSDIRHIVSRIRRSERTQWVEELSGTGVAEILQTLSEIHEGMRAGTRPGRPRRERLPSPRLILGAEEEFERKFLDLLSESDE
jgi:hypothetical protein